MALKGVVFQWFCSEKGFDFTLASVEIGFFVYYKEVFFPNQL